ncbi:MAG TPA: butyrate kinase [Firmicutes bacterium]|nr:butyrate kinase [Bacillota bacterium]
MQGTEKYRILVINPGSTSTKIAVYDGSKRILSEKINHTREEILSFARVVDQFDFRYKIIKEELEKKGIALTTLHAVVGRGGMLHPLAGGTYEVNEKMLADLREGVQGQHPANLGGLIAHVISQQYGIPAYVVDPIAVDEMEDVSRLSGFKAIKRRSLGHALNVRRVARLAARDLGKEYGKTNLILAHLGGGISIYAQRQGRLVDVENSNHEGPFSPERAGGLSTTDLINLCFSGRYTREELLNLVLRQGGVCSYLGTADIEEVEGRIQKGDREAQLVLEAMILQIAKCIGAMAAVLEGQVDGIVLTGGLAHSRYITGRLRQRVGFIAPVLIYPGEEEMTALAEGALRVLTGQEEAKQYVGEEAEQCQ